MDLDEALWLTGDEDCGVGLNCRRCDRGGLPISYYPGISNPYEGRDDVTTSRTIAGLLDAGRQHMTDHH